MSCAAARERAPELALGLLSGAERAEVLLHVNGCAPCQAAVTEMAEVADLLPQLVPELEPPAGFADRVVAAGRGNRRRVVRRWVTALTAAAAAAAIVSVAAVRIVDAGRGTDRVEAAPRLRSVAMVGGNEQWVGRVAVAGDDRAAVAVDVDYAIPDGNYTLELGRPGAMHVIGSLSVVAGHGEWTGVVDPPPGTNVSVAMIDATKHVVCRAELGLHLTY